MNIFKIDQDDIQRFFGRAFIYAGGFVLIIVSSTMSKGLIEQGVIKDKTVDEAYILAVSIWILFVMFDLIVNSRRDTAFQHFYNRYLKDDHEQQKVILNPFIRLYKRLFDYSNDIKKRSQLALIIGLLLGLLPLFLLLYLKNEELNTYVLINRGLLVITIESVAFYFFNLYRSSLNNIKYYQNELSNIDLKMVSVLHALQRKDNDLLDKIAHKFIDEERNIIVDSSIKGVDVSSFDQVNKVLDKIAAIIKSSK
jgi:hypothetical protein